MSEDMYVVLWRNFTGNRVFFVVCLCLIMGEWIERSPTSCLISPQAAPSTVNQWLSLVSVCHIFFFFIYHESHRRFLFFKYSRWRNSKHGKWAMLPIWQINCILPCNGSVNSNWNSTKMQSSLFFIPNLPIGLYFTSFKKKLCINNK